ncbi:hypothetical protein RVBP18_0150 [Pseudomonas phage sp. LC]|nr:hypothetical protein RVBP18_0150 [Pseudomonas phage sp. LC]
MSEFCYIYPPMKVIDTSKATGRKFDIDSTYLNAHIIVEDPNYTDNDNSDSPFIVNLPATAYDTKKGKYVFTIANKTNGLLVIRAYGNRLVGNRVFKVDCQLNKGEACEYRTVYDSLENELYWSIEGRVMTDAQE